jgi:hypothetical protein
MGGISVLRCNFISQKSASQARLDEGLPCYQLSVVEE